MRCAQGDHPRVVGRHPVHSARAKAHDEPDQPVLPADAWTPAVHVSREGDAGENRQEVVSVADAHHFLDQHAHSLVVVDQVFLPPVADRVRAKGAGVHLGHGADQGLESLLQRTLVRQENGVVLAGKGGTEIVLQQTRGTHDQRVSAHFFEQFAESIHDFRRKFAVLENLLDDRVLLADLLQRLVLLIVENHQAVFLDELLVQVRAQVVGVGDRQRKTTRLVYLRRFVENAVGQKHPGCFPADLADSVSRSD